MNGAGQMLGGIFTMGTRRAQRREEDDLGHYPIYIWLSSPRRVSLALPASPSR